jgi:hypothetical protein
MSETSAPKAVKPTRIRSERQLHQKRVADRVKKGENRLQHKHRLERIEADIIDIKHSLQNLALHLQKLPQALTPICATPTAPPKSVVNPLLDLGPMPITITPPTLHQKSSFSIHLANTSNMCPVQASSCLTTSAQGQGAYEATKLINCRCGSEHFDRFDSLDTCNVTILYQGQITLSSNPNAIGGIPRNPSVPAMLLHSMEENIITFLITGFLRQYKVKTMAQLMGFYLLGYRYMRVSHI